VSAALIPDVSANAGVADEKAAARPIGAASLAARVDSAPMVVPQPMILRFRRAASLPDAAELLGAKLYPLRSNAP
jgi:hypothetical protein